MKLQIPSSKFQGNSNLQTPMRAQEVFGTWDLELLWNLEFGAWNFL